MIIKKFQAGNETDAILMAKEELGSSAVVLNVKTIKHKGFMKLFKPTLVEVTAALEETEDVKAASPAKEESINLQADEKIVFPSITREPESVQQAFAFPDLEKDDKAEKSETAIEEKLDSLQSLLEKQLHKDSQEEILKDDKEEETDETVQFLQLIYNTLLANEVDEKYANQIIDEVDKSRTDTMNLDVLLANIYQKLILKLGRIRPIKNAENKVKIVYFVGPTGVGKTTTIAKIASKFKIEEKKKVVLLTADTYRIAAAEQLHTYANIMDVPFKVVYTPEEVENAIEEYKEFDYILIDTAGYSPNNEEQQGDIRRFINAADENQEKEVYLVISVTTKYKDLLNIADSYTDIKDLKLIFTKLDETTTLGNILNIKMYTGLDLSYITCGQNVPDDISEFDAQTIVKKLLGGK